jgi:hypothetical protein
MITDAKGQGKEIMSLCPSRPVVDLFLPNRFDEIKPKVYERLLRKLLNKKNKPAVVLVQLMPKGMAFGPGNREKAPFHATLEDAYAAQAQYYDLPWLSFRNALYRLAEFHV